MEFFSMSLLFVTSWTLKGRGITSLYYLELAIFKNEGIEWFEELGLGPLVCHPLVEHYFSVPLSVTEVFKITSEDIICYLQEYMDKNKRKMIMAQEFLDFIAVQKAVKCKEMLCVRIRILGLHISHIREARKAETALRRTSNIIRKNRNMESSSEDCDSPNHWADSQRRKYLTRDLVLYPSVSNYSPLHGLVSGQSIFILIPLMIIRMVMLMQSLMMAFDADDDEEDDDFNTCQFQNSSTGKDSGHSVSSCPYPSTTEEMARLRLKAGSSKKPSSGNGRIKEKGGQSLSGRKRKFEKKNRTAIYPQKLQDKDRGIESKLYRMKYKDFILPGGDIAKFVGMWKKACKKHTIFEVVDMMLNFYMPRHSCKRKIKKV